MHALKLVCRSVGFLNSCRSLKAITRLLLFSSCPSHDVIAMLDDQALGVSSALAVRQKLACLMFFRFGCFKEPRKSSKL